MRSKQAPRAKHLFTDASCILQRGIASWAAMLVDGFQSEMLSGLIGSSPKSGNEAELHGVRYALRGFVKRGLIAKGDTIIIHCDNLAVCNALFTGDLRWRRQDSAKEFEQIMSVATDLGLTICAQWIKGHQGFDTTDWRSLINQRVDREARAITRAENRRRISLGDIGRLKQSEWIEE